MSRPNMATRVVLWAMLAIVFGFGLIAAASPGQPMTPAPDWAAATVEAMNR